MHASLSTYARNEARDAAATWTMAKEGDLQEKVRRRGSRSLGTSQDLGPDARVRPFRHRWAEHGSRTEHAALRGKSGQGPSPRTRAGAAVDMPSSSPPPSMASSSLSSSSFFFKLPLGAAALLPPPPPPPAAFLPKKMGGISRCKCGCPSLRGLAAKSGVPPIAADAFGLKCWVSYRRLPWTRETGTLFPVRTGCGEV